jgi:SAM-dependent methyltransferase
MILPDKYASEDIFTYSQIMDPSDYNEIMSEQHLYISAADKFLADTIRLETKNSFAEVVELGCGPGRIFPIVRAAIPNAHITAVEADLAFANYARRLADDLSIDLVVADVEFYRHQAPVDVFYSQGFHHHVTKGTKTRNYLKNISTQLRPGGIYVLSDEFLPEYRDTEERERRVIVWYCHIIAHALLHNYNYLAQEEAKTLLDDLYEGRQAPHLKNTDQINYVLSKASIIDSFAREGNLIDLASAVDEFQTGLKLHYNWKSIGDPSIDLSRHDYKICERVLSDEIRESGLTLESVRSFGPLKDIGAMSVWIFKK